MHAILVITQMLRGACSALHVPKEQAATSLVLSTRIFALNVPWDTMLIAREARRALHVQQARFLKRKVQRQGSRANSADMATFHLKDLPHALRVLQERALTALLRVNRRHPLLTASLANRATMQQSKDPQSVYHVILDRSITTPKRTDALHVTVAASPQQWRAGSVSPVEVTWLQISKGQSAST